MYMSIYTYYRVASSVFFVVGALHLLRIFNSWEAVIAGVVIPLWVSWVAVAIAWHLSIRGIMFVSKMSSTHA